ncbi:hypothetical protein EPI10_022083 [Gossypium australe]|uniref:Uncharacterized protein n=1 Tax=Gossypium australe TaxID=47621 RepID=A0A5B6WLL5_9ROSI|nr:hypothetical protein EPI10_022083 [Gossypium australe]
MQVERKKRRNLRDNQTIKPKNMVNEILRSRFSALNGLAVGEEENMENMKDSSNKNGENLGHDFKGNREKIERDKVGKGDLNGKKKQLSKSGPGSMTMESPAGGSGPTLLELGKSDKTMSIVFETSFGLEKAGLGAELSMGIRLGKWAEVRKHFVDTFKEKDATHNTSTMKGVTIGGGIQVKHSNKGRGSGKSESNHNDRKLNKIIQEREDHFKLASSIRVPLSNTMNSMVELINSQLEKELDKANSSINGMRFGEPGTSEQ